MQIKLILNQDLVKYEKWDEGQQFHRENTSPTKYSYAIKYLRKRRSSEMNVALSFQPNLSQHELINFHEIQQIHCLLKIFSEI